MPAPSLVAHFQPQAWQNDHAIEVDGAREFDCGAILLALEARQFRAAAASIRAGNDHALDCLAEAAGLVGGADGHDGPFSVTVDDQAFETFLDEAGIGKDEPASMTDERLTELRRTLDVRTLAEGKEISPDVLLRTRIGDWRKADGMADELAGMQTEDWGLEVVKGGYAGVNLRFTAPDGSTREVVVEIDKGNVALTTYRGEGEDPDAKITITANETHVRSQQPTGARGERGYAFDGEGARTDSYEPEEGFSRGGPRP